MSCTFTVGRYATHPTLGEIISTGIGHDHRVCPEPCPEFVTDMYCEHVYRAQTGCHDCSRSQVQVSYTDARILLSRMGFVVDEPGSPDQDSLVYGGHHDAEDFLGRILVANVGHLDSGVAPLTGRGRGGALLVDCGRRAGYYTDTADRLSTLAVIARERGDFISWG